MKLKYLDKKKFLSIKYLLNFHHLFIHKVEMIPTLYS